MKDYTITYLDISNRNLTALPEDLPLYTNLTHLDCIHNKLTRLDHLPQSLFVINLVDNPALDGIKNIIKMLDNVPPHLVLILNNEKCNSRKKHWERLGKHYGYPDCCIDAFIKRSQYTILPIPPNRIQSRVSKHYGFNPCSYCSWKVLSRQCTLEDLIQNRQCNELFGEMRK